MNYRILSTNEIDPSDVFDRLKELHDELCSESADYAAICGGRSPDKLSEFIDKDSSGRDLLSELDEADLDVDLDELIADGEAVPEILDEFGFEFDHLSDDKQDAFFRQRSSDKLLRLSIEIPQTY